MNTNTPAEVLNVTQETLRVLTICLAASANADMARLSELLRLFAEQPVIDPLARAMLLDIAKGVEVIHTGKIPAGAA